MDAFILGHWERTPNFGISPEVVPNFHEIPGLLCFETCRRVLWLSFSGHAPFAPLSAFNLDFYEGSSAYKFLLEIISGLHSPIFGETEVLGQFREFLRKNSELGTQMSAQFRPWSIFLLEDSKAIRHEYLQGAGQNSYGSVVRRWTRDLSNVAVIGTGHLATELLPWVPKNTVLFSRNPIATRERIPTHKVSAFAEFSHLPAGSAVVIAAPMKCEELEALKNSTGEKDFFWIDLRAERGAFKSHRNLDQVFAEQELSKSQSEEFKSQLHNELLRRSLKRWNHVHHRPYGWEDLTS